MMHRSALLLTFGFIAAAEAYLPSFRPPGAPQRVSAADEPTRVFDFGSDAGAYSPPDATTRRAALWRFSSAFTAAIATLAVSSEPAPSVALDMDAFASRELGTSGRVEPAKMSDDEALCKFGAPSKATGDACLRAGLSTKRPTGVDAFGSVDRGDFVRCKPKYVDDPKRPGMLINVWDCQ